MPQLSGSLEISGSIIATGGITISGSIASASYAQSSSLAANSNLLSGRDVNSFSTTGSNSFNGNQIVTGSLTVTGQVIAQTLNVQQVTSSVVYSSGSNVFGNNIANTHQFTGSMSVTGSITSAGQITIQQSGDTTLSIRANSSANTARILFNNSTTSVWGLFKDTSPSDFRLYNYSASAFAMTIAVSNNAVTLNNLAGSGDRMVKVSSTGQLGIATAGTDFVAPSALSGYVDLTTNQTVGGVKTFTSAINNTYNSGNFNTFRTNDVTSANNAGGGFYNVASATGSSRLAALWLDADGGDFASGDYGIVEKIGGGGKIRIMNFNSTGIAFGTAGTEYVTIDGTNGSLSGTSLSMSGAGTFAGNITTKANTYNGFIADNTTALGGGYFIAKQNGTTIGSFSVSGAIEGNTDANIALFAETGKSIKFFTNGSVAASVLTLASTGAATFSSSGRFEGDLNVGAGSNNYFTRVTTAYNFPYVDSYIDSYAGTSYEGRLNFRTNSGGGTMGTRMTITNDGNMGINQSSPTNYSGFTTLHINGKSGGNGGLLRLTSFDNSASVNIYTGANAVLFNTTATIPFVFLTQDTERLRLTSGGSLGVNTNSPNTTLSVNGTTSSTIFTAAYQYHGVKLLSYDAASAITINLATEFPQVLLVVGNVWGVIGKCCLFGSGGSIEVREFYIGRNASGTWSTANYSASSNTVAVLQSVTGSGSSITINMNSGTYLTVELTVLIR